MTGERTEKIAGNPDATKVVEIRRDVNLKLENSDVEYLLVLLRKQKFGIEETYELGKVRKIASKLQGFDQLELIESVPEPDDMEDPNKEEE